MPLPFRPNCLPSMLGPLPHTDADTVWPLVLERLRQLPPLPLLAPEGEQLLALAVDGFPGALFDHEQLHWDVLATHAALHELYVAYLRRHAASRSLELVAIRSVEEQRGLLRFAYGITTIQWGPFSLALMLVNDQHETALGDPTTVDALCKHLSLRLEWQAETLLRWGKPVLQWLYEPYLELVGSPFVPWGWTELRAALGETFAYQRGVRGVWIGQHADLPELLTDTLVEVLGLALPSPEQAALWAPTLSAFVQRKGVIGWGIIPTTSEGLRNSSAARLATRFGQVLQALDAHGLPTERIIQASIIMPEDTLDRLSPTDAERAMRLTSELAMQLRHAYAVDD